MKKFMAFQQPIKISKEQSQYQEEWVQNKETTN